MNYKDFAKQDAKRTKDLLRALPEEMEGFKQMRLPSLEDKALSGKTKELIALGIGVGIRCESCIVAHTKRLIAMDVSREEILETLAVTLYMGGGPATSYAGKALACFDELMEEKKSNQILKSG